MIRQANSIRNTIKCIIGSIAILVIFLTSCTPNYPVDSLSEKPTQTNTIQAPNSISTTTYIPLISVDTPSPTFTDAFAANTEFDPECLQPSENYDRLEINGHIINQRTYEMLAYTQTLYAGEINLTGEAITQGSYTNAVEASFGTHSGGGAVDLSVMAPGTYEILYEDIPSLIHALRLAGFAAWYRDFNELYEGSPPHIHTIAIGDRELSIAAREQLAGPFGYFWGYNGLPTEDGIPIRDSFGGPTVCEWMLEKGYPDKTATPGLGETIP